MSLKKYNIKSKRSNPTSQFDKRLILQIVKEVEGGLPRKEACSIYGMAYGTINEWMRTYSSESYNDSLRSRFSVQQRRNIVRLVQKEQITKQQAASFIR